MSFSEGISRYSRVKKINCSTATLAPGDLITFMYEGSRRVGLVVRSRKTGMGVTRITTRNNLIVNTYLIDSISDAMLDVLLNNLYKNRITSTYKNSPKILSAFLGKDNFRTFISSKMSNMKEFFIDKKSLEEEENND